MGLLLTLIAVTAAVCQWVAWRVKLPAILFLLATGVVLGPGLGVLNPDAVFGELLFPLVSLSVAVILFEGGLTLNFSEIRNLKTVVRRLVLWGALLTWAVIAVAVHFLVGLDWNLSVLFGAIAVVTGPTVIAPMLRTVRPTSQISSILRWEGIIIDPLGALLAVVVFEFIISQTQGEAFGPTLLLFSKVLVVGLVFGVLAGWGLGQLLKRHAIPEYLRNLTTLSVLFAAFSLSNALAHESGLLAVTIMGMWLANTREIQIRDILNFKENLTILLISGLFIVLAARLDFGQLTAVGLWPLAGLLLVAQLIARPLSVGVTTLGSTLTWRERLLLAWIAPRGIVAAAVSALFALRLSEAGFEDSELLVPLTFLLIVGTVVLQSATARRLAEWLQVAEPEPRGFLIIGANPVARRIAKMLQELDFRALLVDSSWDNISAARMEGLDTFFGNPVSEHADQRLDLVGIGRLLALSPQRDLNVVASMRYRTEFGQNHIYTILTSAEARGSEKQQVAPEHRGYTLFDPDLTYGKFASLISRGAELKKTRLSEEFTFDDFYATHGERAVPLFALSPDNKLEVFVVGGKVRPGPGWTLISLMAEADSQREEPAKDDVQPRRQTELKKRSE